MEMIILLFVDVNHPGWRYGVKPEIKIRLLDISMLVHQYIFIFIPTVDAFDGCELNETGLRPNKYVMQSSSVRRNLSVMMFLYKIMSQPTELIVNNNVPNESLRGINTFKLKR